VWRARKSNTSTYLFQFLPPSPTTAVKVDSQTDYSKLRVKELKAILAERGVECTGCLEKPDFIKKCEETAHLSAEL
jgi:hypothetical protein